MSGSPRFAEVRENGGVMAVMWLQGRALDRMGGGCYHSGVGAEEITNSNQEGCVMAKSEGEKPEIFRSLLSLRFKSIIGITI